MHLLEVAKPSSSSSSSSSGDQDDEPEASSATGAPPEYCTDHENQELRYFCFTCNSAACGDCLTQAHKKHDSEMIFDAFKILTTRATELLDRVPAKIAKLQETSNLVKSFGTAVSNREAKLLRQLNADFDEFRDRLNDLHKDLESKLKDKFKAHTTTLMKQRRSLDNKIGEIKALRAELSVEYLDDPPSNLVDVLSDFAGTLNDLRTCINTPHSTRPQRTSKVKFVRTAELQCPKYDIREVASDQYLYDLVAKDNS